MQNNELHQLRLSTGAIVSVNDHRVRVDIDIGIPSSTSTSSSSCTSCCSYRYQCLSSATLNGGNHTFVDSANNNEVHKKTKAAHVINYKVPDTYDGLHPPPLQLLANFAKKEIVDDDDDHDGMVLDNTIGLLTAASMKTMTTASRSIICAGGEVNIDVIVTAGLSNARSVCADADYFVCCESNSSRTNDEDMTHTATTAEQSPSPVGTINTIVIVNGAPLTPAAQVEAYAIAIEAKCASCVKLGVLCAKDPTNYGMGTGTDCCVLLSPCIISPKNHATTATTTNTCCSCVGGGGEVVVKHAGKHTLFAEMLGQAVQEATTEAIMINIRHLHYNFATYTLQRWIRILRAGIMKGVRPSYIPRNPMVPVPRPPLSVTSIGLCFVFVTYLLPFNANGKLLVAAVTWDRFLGEPPLRFHPVCIAGSMINLCLSWCTPVSHPRIFSNPMLGLFCGFTLLASMLVIFLYGAWKYLHFTDAIILLARRVNANGGDNLCHISTACNNSMISLVVEHALEMMGWVLKLLLLKSTLSLQLLCTVALQMAHYLERDQIDEARIQLAWLCSRDASKLGSSDLAGATLESLSENLSDGFIAPLFWYVLLGPMGALGYRIVNTLDSRIGYRGKFEWFGKASARLDDLVNFVPARLTALLLAFAACPTRGWTSARKGLQTAWTDVEQCESPNAGWPMACFAGVLGVRLMKEGAYCLGADGANPRPVDIRVGHTVTQVAGGVSILVSVIITSIY